ncbi:glutathione-dependent formaldehyde-activating protein [Marinobacter lipolyticus SM19]|uniref:Glutathione-dependent formaldehyde-activating protein n=1 Tax=Marinobacter lipolyticus SM19 TaxID=1318628 RepID=R8B309_9GAMM|nr:glutathione-dependent formaldehyde-activating protein [Marinobacter lipolyticus SM19]
MKQTGRCLCGGIQYEINAPLGDVLNCHCSMCRKLHASVFRINQPRMADAPVWPPFRSAIYGFVWSSTAPAIWLIIGAP